MSDILDLVRDELLQPVDARVAAMAAAIAARHGTASRSVLFYGSCLRQRQLEGLMLDFYLIVSDYRSAFERRWLAVANRLVPPNVFPFEHDGLIAKYAVLSEADFHRLNGPETRSVSVWARFAQPSRLAWSSDARAEERALAAVARAAPTLLRAALPVVRNDQPPLDLWRAAFALTYSAELRAEKKDKGGSVVDADPDRYRRFTAPALAAARAGGCRRHVSWRRRRIEGKLLSLVRLAKASATFAGGAEYIAWKINRHAGTQIELKNWQKRWPLLAALTLAPRLIRLKAVR
jgi:hypothetical protein